MKYFTIFILCLASIQLNAQSVIGIEVQAYPAGIIPAIRFDYGIGNNSFVNLRLGYNFTDRRDWGEHENEEGSGPGFSFGYEYKNLFTDNLSLQLRTDLWFMEIDWYDPPLPGMMCGPLPCPDQTGSTNITVLQPTIGLGYKIGFNDHFFTKPTVSFGREINIKTEGEPVGEGAILLGGLEFGYQF